MTLQDIHKQYTTYTYFIKKVERFFVYSLFQNTVALQYLYSRGLNDVYIRYFNLGFDPGIQATLKFLSLNNIPSDLLFSTKIAVATDTTTYNVTTNRVVFPIVDILGNTVGFSGNILPNYNLNKTYAKYINTPASDVFSKSLILFNLYNAVKFIKESNYVLLVEGNFDVVTLFAHGIRNVVAPCGTSFTQFHAYLLRYFTKNIVLVYDSDVAGNQAYRRTLPIVAKADMISSRGQLPVGEDPDSYVLKYGKDKFLKDIVVTFTRENH